MATPVKDVANERFRKLDASSYWYVLRRDTLKDAAGDVCPICGNRKPGPELQGPNSAGNFTHGKELCPASPIWARMMAYYRRRNLGEQAQEAEGGD